MARARWKSSWLRRLKILQVLTGMAVLTFNTSTYRLRLSMERPWTFVGPDGKPYTWQIMFRYPVVSCRPFHVCTVLTTVQLFASGNALVPLARYKHAKLGIVSRSRRASLEIFPAGINTIDLIVISFVSYAKHYWLDEPDHTPIPSAA